MATKKWQRKLFAKPAAVFVDEFLGYTGKRRVFDVERMAYLIAAYESARTAARVTLPFETSARRPIDLWRG